MKPGDIVRVVGREKWASPELQLYKFPTFLGGRSCVLCPGHLGLIVKTIHFEEYGTSVLLLCGKGVGWTHIHSLEVIP